MHLYIVVNDAREVEQGSATRRFADRAEALFDEVTVVGVTDFEVTSAQRIMVRSGPETPRPLDENTAVLVRTSPGRDLMRWQEHATCLSLLQTAAEHGAKVENSPMGLHRASSKLYLHRLDPEIAAPSFISAHPAALESYVDKAKGRVVLKPLRGSMGHDVFVVDKDQRENLHAILAHLTRVGYVVAQPFLPEVTGGDLRVIVLDGDVLSVGGEFAAVRRVPQKGSFRANVHAGARAVPATLSAAVKDRARRISAQLVDDGVRFAGLDFVGDTLIEANVFSPGGLTDTDAFYGVDFTSEALRRLYGLS